MPLSRTRSLFRSLSAGNVHSDANTSQPPNALGGSANTSRKPSAHDHEGNDSSNHLGSTFSFTLPTLSSLANITSRRGSRAKSTVKRKSDGDAHRDHRQKSRDGSWPREQQPNSSGDSSQYSPKSPSSPSSNGKGHAHLKVPSVPSARTPSPAPAPAPATAPLPPPTPPPHRDPPLATLAPTEPEPAPAPEPTSFSANPSQLASPDTPANTTSINTTLSTAGAVTIATPNPLSPRRPLPTVTTHPPLLVLQPPSTPNIPTLPSSSCPRYESPEEMQRKIWVKRPGASATRVEVAEDDLVDNVRDVILHKYANSLGRNIDAPDITLKIINREQGNKSIPSERALGPEEPIGTTLDTYYPRGQTVDEALIIEVSTVRRTPRPSPRAGNHQISYYYQDHYRPPDDAREYFPPMPLHSPHLSNIPHPSTVQHSMSVLTTGQLPPLPSPGSHGRRNPRPRYGRQHTSSPTILHTVQPNGQVLEPKSQMNGTNPTAPPLPTSPTQGDHKQSISPPNRVTSPPPGQKQRRRRNPVTNRSANGDPPPSSTKPASAALLDGSVPPINVLLVEDNVINLKLLEAFMKRLKVRWQSAMNGKEAVTMWRKGGFHLVLMDIQLPVMNGLEATKEIRRLEAVNGIGVFGGSPVENHPETLTTNGAPEEADALHDRDLFKSPVIIVALTASSLQSDRHEALAAGCNDFLTKPVNFVWMERKVTEWGCMQALIDFDGWRKWKQYAKEKAQEDPAKKAAEEKEEKAKAKAALKAMFSRPPPSTKKDSSDSVESPGTTDRVTSPAPNGQPKKTGSPTSNGAGASLRGHKGNRGSVNGGRGGLESMAEEHGEDS
ncbi:Two-component response regulator SSK1p [Exophiala xenobiotica]